MFQYTEKVLAQDTFLFQIKRENQLLTFEQVIELWKTSADFRFFYNQILKEVPFLAFFWEHKPVNQHSLSQIYEFVIIKTTAFNGKQANQQAFKSHFLDEQPIVCFPNLTHTAQLIVPTPFAPKETYTHLASFIRNAPNLQVDFFWKTIGFKLEEALQEAPIWLSTSGLGIHWLHVRLDQRPKYYNHSPYKSF